MPGQRFSGVLAQPRPVPGLPPQHPMLTSTFDPLPRNHSNRMASTQPGPWWARAIATLSKPVDGASLAVFRICFGLLVAYEIDFKFKIGKVEELYAPQYNFKYHFFEWVPSLDASGAYALHFAMIGLALLVAAGAFYRVTSVLLCAALSYYFLSERTLYINHTYLYCLLAGILATVPAHNMLSVDARYGWLGARPKAPGRTPLWSVWLLRFQMGVVYTYAGLAKLNPDWLQGSPLNLWLPAQLGASHWLWFDSLPLLMSWGGAAFDLCITPLLLWKKTRTFAFLWACAFHLVNASIFGIASFPWMSIALTLLFFEPDWPRQQWPSLGRMPKRGKRPNPLGKPGFAALLAYVAVQVALPTRPWFYPGNSDWTEEGHEFSWHMMLRAKSGTPKFTVMFSDGKRQPVNALEYLTQRQLTRIQGRPALLHQFAVFLADEYERSRGERPQVFVESEVGFNGRAPAPVVDPTIDLASQTHSLAAADWILPQPGGPPGFAQSAESED